MPVIHPVGLECLWPLRCEGLQHDRTIQELGVLIRPLVSRRRSAENLLDTVDRNPWRLRLSRVLLISVMLFVQS